MFLSGKMMTNGLFVILVFLCLIISSYSLNQQKGDMNQYFKRTGHNFLNEVSMKPGIQKLKSGMLIEVLKTALNDNAKSPTKFDSCEVTYKGTLKDGKVFDSGSRTFSPNQVIKGWSDALQMMGEGDKWRLYIPYELAYGEVGNPPSIPPYSPLVFELEIHRVKSTGGKSLSKARELFRQSLELIQHSEL